MTFNKHYDFDYELKCKFSFLLSLVLATEPHFRQSYGNLTFTIGQNARLVCSVNTLGKYQVNELCF